LKIRIRIFIFINKY